MRQEQGLAGRLVGGMIRRSVKSAFRRVYWRPPDLPLRPPVVFACTHTGWHDGYLMFLAVSKLGIPTLDWIAEFDAFPLFEKVGGLPFPPHDEVRRRATIKKTWEKMEEGWSMMVFGDGVLRRPGEPWAVGRAVEAAVTKFPHASIVPVAISYDMSVHERPEAYLTFGAPLSEPFPQERGALLVEVKTRIEELEEQSRLTFGQESNWQVLQNCRLDVNERWDMRKSPLGRS